MKRFLPSLFSLCMYFFSYSIYAQELTSSEHIQAKLDSFTIQQPVEKIYIQFDKEVYIPGETIWFKAYLLEGRSHMPSYLSLIAYVEFWTAEDSLLARKVVKIGSGQGSGSFQIDEDWEGGELRVQGYTQWMRNRASFFEHQLQVLGLEEDETASDSLDRVPDVQFLPEGGIFLAGCTNQLGIKAINSQGVGIPIEGVIRDDQGAFISEFNTSYRGMGVLAFSPEPSTRYWAEYIWESDTFTVALPLPKAKGIRIQVKPSSFITQVDLFSTRNTVASLVGISRGELCFFLKMQLKPGSNSLDIPNSTFPTGILQLTVLEGAHKPVCERMLWIDKQDQLAIGIEAPSQAVGKRELVSISVETAEIGGLPEAANMSVSITAQNAWRENLLWRKSLPSYMLLASEAKGTVEAPWLYLHGEPFNREKIDWVMLTHFWRKIEWEQLSQPNDSPPEFLVERSLFIEGKSLRGKNKPYGNSSVILIIDNMFNIHETQTDAEGNFVFEGLDYADTSLVLLQIKNDKDKQRPAQFQLKDPSLIDKPLFSLRDKVELPTPENFAYIQQTQTFIENERLLNGEASYELEAVEITGRREYKEEKYDFKRMYARADRTLNQALMENKPNIIEVLRANYPGVNIIGTPGNYSFQPVLADNPLGGTQRPDPIMDEIFPREPTFFIDGIQTEIHNVEMFPVERVDFIDLVFHERAGLLGKRGNLGLVSIFTKDGVDYVPPGKDQQKGIVRTQLPGFSVPRTFYQPKYELEEVRKLPDLRNTLLWEPFVETDITGHVNLEFYTGDVPGKYRIVVEGMTADGRLGYAESWIEVR